MAALPIDPNVARVNTATTDLTVGGVVPVAIGMWDGSTFRPAAPIVNVADGHTGYFAMGVAPVLFNGTTWDRERGNIEGTALASSARTATTSSSDIINYNARGIRVFIHCSVVPGSAPSNTVSIEEKSPISGTYTARLTSAAFTSTGEKPSLTLYPGATVAANVAVSEPLPRTFRITVTAGNANSATYSISYSLIL